MKFGSDQLQLLIPHRRPFNFVESAEIVGQSEINGVCTWDLQNPIFEGHFPEFSVVPGVLIVEAAAQLAGVLIAYNGQKILDDAPGGASGQYIGVLIGIKRASFHKPVFPGDKISFKVSVGNPMAGMIIAKGEAVGADARKICKCELSIAIVEKSSLIGSDHS